MKNECVEEVEGGNIGKHTGLWAEFTVKDREESMARR